LHFTIFGFETPQAQGFAEIELIICFRALRPTAAEFVRNEPRALPGKMATASLTLYTFNTLYSYGYKNVYELPPLIDIKKSVLTFEGSLAPPNS
jgi:hypothetical protein